MRILIALLVTASIGLVACNDSSSNSSTIQTDSAAVLDRAEQQNAPLDRGPTPDTKQLSASNNGAQDTAGPSHAVWKIIRFLTPFFAAVLAFMIGRQLRRPVSPTSASSKADESKIKELLDERSQLREDIQTKDAAWKNALAEGEDQRARREKVEQTLEKTEGYLAAIVQSILPDLASEEVDYFAERVSTGDKNILQFVGAYLSLLENPGSRHNQLEMSESVYKILPVPQFPELDFQLKKQCNEIAGFTLFQHVTVGENFDSQLHDSKSGHGPYVSKIQSYIVMDEAGRVVRKASVEQSTSK